MSKEAFCPSKPLGVISFIIPVIISSVLISLNSSRLPSCRLLSEVVILFTGVIVTGTSSAKEIPVNNKQISNIFFNIL